MKTALARIEDGHIVLDHPLPNDVRGRALVLLPEDGDSEREWWLKSGERRLMEVWDNDQDDIYNELLSV